MQWMIVNGQAAVVHARRPTLEPSLSAGVVVIMVGPIYTCPGGTIP